MVASVMLEEFDDGKANGERPFRSSVGRVM